MSSTILTILSLSISGSILALLLLALRPLLKNRVSKAFQYYIWLLVLLRLALPLSFDGSIMNRLLAQPETQQAAISGAVQPIIPAQGDEQAAVPQIAGTEPNGTGGAESAAAPSDFHLWAFLGAHLPEIWLVGAALHFGWFILAYLRFGSRLRKTCVRPHPKDAAVFAWLRGCAKVKLVCNPYIDTPMMIRLPVPLIVIPQLAFVENGMKPELQHILRHELTHCRRHDLLYKWFVALVSSLHWFNPLMILVRREIGRACELSCDEAVVRSLDLAMRQSYGETLLAIASSKRLPAGIVATTMCEEKRALKERLESIMTYKSKGVLMIALSLGLALLIAGCSVALGAANTAPIVTHALAASEKPEQTAAQTSALLPDVTGDPAGTMGPDETPQPAVTEASQQLADPTPASGGTADSSNAAAETDGPTQTTYSAVLQNKAQFYSTDSKKSVYLKDFLANGEIYDTTFTVLGFAVLDLDGDSIPEVVLELSVANEPQFFEVLHAANGTVYGYLIPYRGLEELKTDGTVLFSSGAADSGWGKLSFKADGYGTDMLGYSQSSQGDTDMTIQYFINDKPVLKETYDSFDKEQTKKKNVSWSKFTPENIKKKLG